MTIRLLTQNDSEEYEKFLHSREDSLFYSSCKYKGFLEDLLDCEANYILNDEQGKITAALPLMIKKGSFGNVINSLPYYGSNGGIIGQPQTNEMINAFHTLANAKDSATSTLISSPFHNSIEDLRSTVTDQRISQITDLKTNSDPESYLWSIIDGSTRRNIKKSQKEGVQVCVENEVAVPFLEKVHNENMLAINGKPKTKEFFEKFPSHFIPNRDYKVIVAKIDNVPVAALLVFYYNKTVEYFTPVIVKEFRDRQPLALILWETMLQGIKEGYYYWNWGGTWLSQEGVYQFKKKWGAQERTYYYSTKVLNEEIFHAPLQMLHIEYPGFYMYNFETLEAI